MDIYRNGRRITSVRVEDDGTKLVRVRSFAEVGRTEVTISDGRATTKVEPVEDREKETTVELTRKQQVSLVEARINVAWVIDDRR